MKLPVTETPLIVWPCYEPAGYSVSLTAEALVQHVLIIGSSGSGKTTLLLGAIEQLVRHPVGLLILDANGCCWELICPAATTPTGPMPPRRWSAPP